MTVTVYYNPRCSKSRRVIEILDALGVDTDVVDYLRTPPDRETLESLLVMLGVPARELVRTGEAAWTDLGLNAGEIDDGALLDAIMAQPILLQRPIVVSGGRAVIARPPEMARTLFERDAPAT